MPKSDLDWLLSFDKGDPITFAADWEVYTGKVHAIHDKRDDGFYMLTVMSDDEVYDITVETDENGAWGEGVATQRVYGDVVTEVRYLGQLGTRRASM